MRALVLFMFLFMVLPTLAAAQEMEIFELRHRLAVDVLPAVQPLLEADGALTGMGNQIIVRTSARNLDEIRRALSALDRPYRPLLVHVSQDRRQSTQGHNLSLAGHSRSLNHLSSASGADQVPKRERRAHATVHGEASATMSQSQVDQSVQVLDGSPALIHIGRTLAVPMRRITATTGEVHVAETVEYVDIGQGFYVTPRLVGDQVTVEITPYSDEIDPSGHISTHRLSTTITGRLGEWIRLGGGAGQTTQTQEHIMGVHASAADDRSSIWLLVEEAR